MNTPEKKSQPCSRRSRSLDGELDQQRVHYPTARLLDDGAISCYFKGQNKLISKRGSQVQMAPSPFLLSRIALEENCPRELLARELELEPTLQLPGALRRHQWQEGHLGHHLQGAAQAGQLQQPLHAHVPSSPVASPPLQGGQEAGHPPSSSSPVPGGRLLDVSHRGVVPLAGENSTPQSEASTLRDPPALIGLFAAADLRPVHHRQRQSLLNHLLPLVQQASQPPSTLPGIYVFCLDVSASMGPAHLWLCHQCSRLCLALAYLACYIERNLCPQDALLVLGFADQCRPILGWRQRGEGFDMHCFLDECLGGICGIRRSGTHLFSAFGEACRQLGQRAQQAGRRGLRGGQGAGGEQQGTCALVLLTDGEAGDASAFAAAHAAVCNTDLDFKGLLIQINSCAAPSRSQPPPLSALAHSPAGEPIPYMSYAELALPPSLDMGDACSLGALSLMSSVFKSFSQLPSSKSREMPAEPPAEAATACPAPHTPRAW